jgi:prophage regulatory protein
MAATIPAGARCLKRAETCRKFAKQKSWLWDRLKNDPTFPRPIYLGPKSPVWLEHELDAWLSAQRERAE